MYALLFTYTKNIQLLVLLLIDYICYKIQKIEGAEMYGNIKERDD